MSKTDGKRFDRDIKVYNKQKGKGKMKAAKKGELEKKKQQTGRMQRASSVLGASLIWPDQLCLGCTKSSGARFSSEQLRLMLVNLVEPNKKLNN